MILADCIPWLRAAPRDYVSAVLTDPPYGLVEYQPEQQRKLRAGRGGVWRIPPSFDGARRMALPRFTVLSAPQRSAIVAYFEAWAAALLPVLRPGAHVAIAGNQLVSPLVAVALEGAGLERRGEIARVVRTLRGGDRPKGAEAEFAHVSTMPRTCWEPWGLYRKPLSEATVAENLRRWGTGALRRVSEQTPFLDLIESAKTPKREREIASHPSLKPQAFLRRVVAALTPQPNSLILDPFAGSGATLAACEALGVAGIGLESDETYFAQAREASPRLAGLRVTLEP